MSVSKLASSSSSLREVSKGDLGLRINSDSNIEMISKMNLKGNERKISMTLRSEKKVMVHHNTIVLTRKE